MKILFEEYHYDKRPFVGGDNMPSLEKVLSEGKVNAKLVENRTKLSIDYVGYFYSRSLDDCVFILPKVLLNTDNKLFDNPSYTPEDFLALSPHSADAKQKEMLDFVYEFSLWVYRAISVFYHNHQESDIALSPEITQMGRGKRKDRYTFLDIVLALLDFNRKNQDYLTFILRNIHKGNNKINWVRTITKNRVIIQDGTPIYYQPVNKKKTVNYDEELLIIFYSILHHINQRYNFPVHLNANFDLITGKRFEQYIKGTGKRRLKQIKYKYFSDRDLEIWDLCYAFFDSAYKVAIHSDTQDYLLIHDFHSVFEDMIDELLSDKDEVTRRMKAQEDGKRLDHLYKYQGLTEFNDKAYYIGDSKYYPRNAAIGSEPIAKQYTYARNLVQYDLDLFNSGKRNYQTYRDDETEGYDIVPNFFISATIDDISAKGYHNSSIVEKKTATGKHFHLSYHFKNRLFDRDTILVSHYNVNFLFIIAIYAKNRIGERSKWAKVVKEKFRTEIIKGLNEEFTFYAITPRENVNPVQFWDQYFKYFVGKVFQPFKKIGQTDPRYYSLALANPEIIDNNPKEKEELANENERILALLEPYFYKAQCPIGTKPEDAKWSIVNQGLSIPVSPSKSLTMHYIQTYFSQHFLVGCYHSPNQFNWIMGKNNLGVNLYNVRLRTQLDKTIRSGALPIEYLEGKDVKFVILYEFDKENDNKYRVFRVHHYATMSEEQMRDSGYPTPDGNYFCFVFDEEVQLSHEINLAKIISDAQSTQDYVDGMPIFKTGEELLNYVK